MGKEWLTDQERTAMGAPGAWLARRSAHWFRWAAGGIAAAALVAVMLSNFWDLAATKSLVFAMAWAELAGPEIFKQCASRFAGGPEGYRLCREPAFSISIRTILAVGVVGIIACLYTASRRNRAAQDG